MTDRTLIIAEAGVNHGGDVTTAKRLIDVAADASADFVKFQTFKAAEVVGRSAAKAPYQQRTTGSTESQLEMLEKLELSADAHVELLRHAALRKIGFLSTPFDLPSVDLLTRKLGLRTIKVPSGEITNAPLLLAVARSSERVIVSTGMATMDEIEAALGILAFGFVARGDAVPSAKACSEAFRSEQGRAQLMPRVTLLHCTSDYPAAVADVNLRAMDSLASAFGVPVGYSDHTLGIHVSLAAVARGARVIEKHFTLDRGLPGPDHAASLEPGELIALVRQIRDIEVALGDGTKRPSVAERVNRKIARRSLVAAANIRAGERFTMENVTAKRPAGGLSPFAYWDVLGRVATRDYEADELIDA